MLIEAKKASDGVVGAVAMDDDGRVLTTTQVDVTLGDLEITNDVGNPIPIITGLSIPDHDYVALSYTGADLTGVVYKTGGSGGTTVATLTLAYTDGILQSVTKS